MKKIFSILLVMMISFSLVACGGSNKPKITPVSGDIIKTEIPEGWIFITGSDMTGNDIADFICHTSKFTVGDPYIQITVDSRELTKGQAQLEAEATFGKYYGEFELNGNTWYIAENAAVAQLGDKVCLVRGYLCDFESDEVRNMLASMEWSK